LREKHKLENVWEYVGPKRDDGTGDWRKLRKSRTCIFSNLHNSILGDKMKKNELGGACGKYGEW
jgi:hypothetical protein